MTRILKYKIEPGEELTLWLPKHSFVTNVGYQQRDVYLWILQTETEQPPENRTFFLAGTGQNIPDSCAYVGTAQEESRGFVWHAFEDRS